MDQICIRRRSDGRIFEVIETHPDGSVTIEEDGVLTTLGPDEFEIVPCPGDPGPGF